ncbi:MAG TPA: hypothetical protein VFG73_10750 [Rhodanobacteraceae bacterium]|nr:hypothetical protein [Rhodanobacteraceae bacterium]
MATPRQYTCDVIVRGRGTATGVVVWLTTASQTEAKKAAQTQFPGHPILAVSNIKLKK